MRKLFATFFAAVLISGCSEFPGVYKIDIPQGNIVTQEMIDKLEPGMTPRQVRFIMGTPLLEDTFHADRWDYIYTMEKDGKTQTRQRVTLYFDEGRLASLTGDFKPGDSATN